MISFTNFCFVPAGFRFEEKKNTQVCDFFKNPNFSFCFVPEKFKHEWNEKVHWNTWGKITKLVWFFQKKSSEFPKFRFGRNLRFKEISKFVLNFPSQKKPLKGSFSAVFEWIGHFYEHFSQISGCPPTLSNHYSPVQQQSNPNQICPCRIIITIIIKTKLFTFNLPPSLPFPVHGQNPESSGLLCWGGKKNCYWVLGSNNCVRSCVFMIPDFACVWITARNQRQTAKHGPSAPNGFQRPVLV